MAFLKSQSSKVEIPDGTYIMEAAESLGVPFGCERGSCATCMTEILSGLHNLSEPSAAEMAMECTGNERLLCQCRIISGEVVINAE